ncbi:MAG: DUF1566 domain-containing protein [Methylovulum sp.]|nr:DUF1566 domain-containing protein [Methylovulum sp.]
MKTKLLLLFLLLFTSTAFATPTTPTSDFIDNNDGTVTHKTTGLTWMRCVLGQTWTGSTCTGTAQTYSYAKAKALTASFAGYSDWRLPNIAELQTIVERENISPAINTSVFPSTPTKPFWSSSPYVGYPDYAWNVVFNSGNVGYGYGRSSSLPVRLVRASQSLGIGLSTPTTDFTDNNDGSVTHKRTGLVWQRCSVGQTWTGSTCSGGANNYTYNAAQQVTSSLAGYSDWRVPTANELASIVSYDKKTTPVINIAVFPNTPPNAFWSSSPDVGSANLAWDVYFDDGYVGNSNRSVSLPVRLVRASQSLVIGLVDLAATITASTNSVKLKQNITYTATMTNNGTGAATNATLIFYFPPRWTTYVTVPSGCLSNGKSYRCNVPSLAAGESLTKAITVNYAQRGALNVVGLAITDSDDTEPGNNKAQVMTTITP